MKTREDLILFATLALQVRVETCVEKGDPRDVICGAAEKGGADLLVMGSHGYGFLQRALLGSVSNHCVQNCKCPVVVVKRPDSKQQRRRESWLALRLES